MMIKNKTYGLVVTAICLAAMSLPSHAWRGGGNGRQGGVRTANGGAAAWNRNTGNAVVRGPNGNTTAVHRGGYNGGYRPPAYGAGYRGGAYYGNNGYSGGQVAGAAVAGLAVGAAIGSSAARNSAPTTQVVVVNSLPAGCVTVVSGSTQYYQCGSTWYQPNFGGNGVYYQPVPALY